MYVSDRWFDFVKRWVLVCLVFFVLNSATLDGLSLWNLPLITNACKKIAELTCLELAKASSLSSHKGH